MGFLKATISFMMGIITLIVVLLVADPVLAVMGESLPPVVIMMCGSLIMVLVALLFYRYIGESEQPDRETFAEARF